MKRLFFGIFLLYVFFGPAIALAAKTTYIYTDRRFHFVKRSELKEKEFRKRHEANHPYEFTGEQLTALLENVRVSKNMVILGEVVEREVFTPSSLSLLTPYLLQAFREAKPNEEVVFSFMTRRSTSGIQDNRLTIVESWVQGKYLHVKFRKLLAKMNITNYDKMGDVTKAMNKAESLRVQLEVGPGQQFGDTLEEILLEIPSKTTAAALQKNKEAVVESKPVQDPREAKQTKAEAKEMEIKLKKLKHLYKKDLITREEYEQKRKEILEQL